MFVRVKKIKGYQYAYLVENSWKKGTSKQKVKDYLGKVFTFSAQEKPFQGDLSGEFKQNVFELFRWQLGCYGFSVTKDAAIKDGLKVDLIGLKFVQEKSGKPFVLKGKDGYLCLFTLKKLLNFESKGYDEKVGKDLAHAFVDAGIDIPQEAFVQVFEKVYKHPEE